jgi:hypothetical protein
MAAETAGKNATDVPARNAPNNQRLPILKSLTTRTLVIGPNEQGVPGTQQVVQTTDMCKSLIINRLSEPDACPDDNSAGVVRRGRRSEERRRQYAAEVLLVDDVQDVGATRE